MELMKLQIILLTIHASILLSWSLSSEMYISTGNEIIQLQASTGDNLTSRVLFNGLDEVEDLDVDRDHNMIYWVDTVLRSINRAAVFSDNISRSDGFETLINNDILKPSCVAVDWIGGNIFFTDVMRRRIEVATADGHYRKVLIHNDLTAPTSIAVDVYSGYMFWIDNSSNPVIERASFDGSDRKNVISHGLINPHTLAIDYNSNGVPLLFWINTVNGFRVIEYSNIDGSNRTELRRWDSTSYPSSLSVSGDDIFWTSNSRDGTIQQFNKANNLTKTFFYQANKKVCDLNTPQTINLTITSSSPCLQNVCDQICLTLPPGNIHKCTCSTGLNLRSNNRSCQLYPNQVLFTAHDTGIKYISLDVEDEFVDIAFPTHANNVNNVNIGIGHMVYWTETATEFSQTSSSAIKRSEMNGANMQTLVQLGLHTPIGLAIDNTAGNLYWLDGHFKRIEVSRLNGSSRKLLIHSNLTDPHGLAIDKSSRGYLYWSDWGNGDDIPARIERAYFDGTQRTTVITFDRGIVPLGITVDLSTSLLYWADSNGTIESCNPRGRRTLESCNVGSRRRRTVFTSSTISNTLNIDGITIVGDYIYWVDKTAGTVWKASKTNASDAREALTGLTNLRGISSTDMLADSGGGNCQGYNSHCSHLCLVTGDGARCECPPGLVLRSDGYHCADMEDIMAYSKPDGITFVQLDMDCNGRPAWLNVTTSDSMFAIDVEVVANRTYWIDGKEKKIYRTNNVRGNKMVVISSGLEDPRDLAVDWLGGNLYWTDQLGGKIEVSKLDGSYRRVLFTGLRSPTLIEVNPLMGVLYVVTQRSFINQYRMDGQGGVIRTLNRFRGYTISAMTVDYENNHLYFKVDDDDDPNTLSRMNAVDFTDVRRSILDFSQNFHYPRPLPPFAVHNGFLYLILENWGMLTFFTARGLGVKCGNRQVTPPVYSTKIIDYERQPGFHWCQLNNGDCDGLCLPQKFGRVCQCPAHQIFDSSTNKCKDVNNFIVFSNTSGIYQLPITDNGDSSVPQLLPLGQGEINGVEYDDYTDQLYWIQTLPLPGSDSSTFSGSVRHGKLSGSDQVVVKDITLINTPWFDMKLDHVGGHVFWTLGGGSQIEVVNMNGQGLAPMLSHIDLNPRSLAFNPEESILYFANWYGTTHFSNIQQLRLNSTETEIVYEESIADNSTGRQDKQDSLFYDSGSGQLYWSDSKQQAVFRCSVKSLPCTDVVTVLKTNVYDSLVFSIDGDFIYWYNSSTEAIYRANKYDGSNPSVFATGIVNLNDFTIGHRRNNLMRTVCTGELRPCSHLCIPKEGNRFECVCPFNRQRSPNNPNNCTNPGCGTNEQLCADGSNCIISQWVCDSHSDCPDGSDESDLCACPHSRYTCDNQQCVPLDIVCDGREHCIDGSDELYCECPLGYAKCPGGRGETCVPRAFFCDRGSDCEIINGTAFDEINCTYESTFTFTPGPTPVRTVIFQGSSSYPAGHTVIIVVCTIMGGLIIVFLAFLILTVCYFSSHNKQSGHYKFNTSTPDTSSRLSSSASETVPNSDFSVPTRSTNVLDSSVDGISYASCLKQQQHSVSQFSLETAVMQEPIYQPPNTPTTNKSVHFGAEGVSYRPRAGSPITINDDTSYAGPCPSPLTRSTYTGMEDDISHITSVSEVAKRRQEQEIREYMRHQRMLYYNTIHSEDYDTTSITSADTKITYNSVSIEPPPPSLASRSMFLDEPPDDYN